jgi:CRP-like cAMP-binding protein
VPPDSGSAWDPPDREWTLRELDLFRDLSDAEVAAIGAAAPMRRVPAGEVLLHPPSGGTGATPEVLYILKRGRVRCSRVGADGRRLTTAILTPGQLFGRMLPLGQHLDDAVVDTLDAATLCVMARPDVDRLLLADPRIATRVLEQLGARVTELERRLGDVVLRPVPARVALALAAMAPEGKAVVRLTHEQLAELVGTTRETTTKVLQDLAARDLVRGRRGRIVVRDAEGLRRLAAQTSPVALGGSASGRS